MTLAGLEDIGEDHIDALAACTALSELEVLHCNFAPEVIQSHSEALAQLSSLTRLVLCKLAMFPAPLAHLPALGKLTLERMGADAALPDGPYLALLRSLYFEKSAITRVPRVLTAATQLRCLGLSGNEQLQITDEDADVILRWVPPVPITPWPPAETWFEAATLSGIEFGPVPRAQVCFTVPGRVHSLLHRSCLPQG